MNKTTAWSLVVIVVIIIGGWLLMRNNDGMDDGIDMPTTTDSVATSTDTNTTGTPTTSDTGSVSTGNVKSFTVEGNNFAFAPKEMKVKKGDTVRVTFKNTGGMHDWKLDEFAGAATRVLQNGEEQTIQFVADKAGTFEYYCSVGTHRQMGMKGNLIVE